MKILNLPAKIETFIFDVDGTLYSNNLYAKAQLTVQFEYLAATRGGTVAEWEKRLEVFMQAWSNHHKGQKISFGNALTYFGIDLDESIRMREKLLKPKAYLKPDRRLRNSLQALKKTAELIVVTNNPSLIGRKTLAALGVEDIFSDVIGLERCRVSKPHKAPFLLAAQQAGSQPVNCVSVGDRWDIDIALPLELGMGAIFVEGVEDVYAIPSSLPQTKREARVKA